MAKKKLKIGYKDLWLVKMGSLEMVLFFFC